MVNRRFLIFFTLIMLCSACTPEAYKQFIPENGSLFNISFKFPSDWEFATNREKGFERILIERPSIYLFFLTDNIYLTVSLDNPGLPAMKAVQEQLAGMRTLPERFGERYHILTDRELTIAGMVGYEVVIKQENVGGFSGLIQICRNIFIMDQNLYYRAVVCVYGPELNNSFSVDFDNLLKSIKKVP